MFVDMFMLVLFYLCLCDYYIDLVLLESNDISNKEECFSFIGFDIIVSFQVQDGCFCI